MVRTEVLKLVFFTCKEVTRMVATDDLERAGWSTRLRARMHLLMCAHCRRYAHQLQAIADRVRALADGGVTQDADALRALEDDITRTVTRGPTS